jgi:hypothetical protein
MDGWCIVGANAYKTWLEILSRSDHLKDMVVDGKIIWKWI